MLQDALVIIVINHATVPKRFAVRCVKIWSLSFVLPLRQANRTDGGYERSLEKGQNEMILFQTTNHERGKATS